MVAQAMVDAKKLFTNIYVGLPSSVNDQRILRWSRLGQEVVHRELMSADSGYWDGIPPCLLGDKGYLLLSWIMVPFKDDGQPRSLAETYFNKRHCYEKSVVENAFGLLKENWHEMRKKTNMHVSIVPNVFYSCCILYNLTIWQGLVNVEEIMRCIALEAKEEV